jgi:hypothetical protein
VQHGLDILQELVALQVVLPLGGCGGF